MPKNKEDPVDYYDRAKRYAEKIDPGRARPCKHAADDHAIELEITGTLSDLIQEFLGAVAKLETRVLAVENAVKELDQHHAAVLKLVGELAKDRLPQPKKRVLN